MRIALVGLMVTGFVMFLASLYWMFWVMMPAGADECLRHGLAVALPDVRLGRAPARRGDRLPPQQRRGLIQLCRSGAAGRLTLVRP